MSQKNQKSGNAAKDETLQSPIAELTAQQPAEGTAAPAEGAADAPPAAEETTSAEGAAAPAEGEAPAEEQSAAASQEPPVMPPVIEDIAPPPVTTEETLAASQEPEAAAEELTPEEEVLAHIQSIIPTVTGFSPEVKAIIARMEQFVATMGRRNITTPEVGAAKQRQLYSDILQATRLADWQVALEVILYYFKKHRKEHFEDRMLLRFMDVARFNRKDLLCFSSLVHLFAIGADPKGRAIVSGQVDFNKLSEMLPDNTARERLLTLFKF